MSLSEEILTFLVAQIPAQSLADFQVSEENRRRAWSLIAREKETGLLPEEKTELDDYLKLEHLVIMAKAKSLAGRNA